MRILEWFGVVYGSVVIFGMVSLLVYFCQKRNRG
jgi:hypothetical protein